MTFYVYNSGTSVVWWNKRILLLLGSIFVGLCITVGRIDTSIRDSSRVLASDSLPHPCSVHVLMTCPEFPVRLLACPKGSHNIIGRIVGLYLSMLWILNIRLLPGAVNLSMVGIPFCFSKPFSLGALEISLKEYSI